MSYLLSGEFHYFRNPRSQWRDRLQQVADAGLEAVSIYVPWNWHEPKPGSLDLTGVGEPEQDLIGALETIAAAGLDCIFRPGPFITAEWRDGGLPRWLWDTEPRILALDVHGRVAGEGRSYPAITYEHPAYKDAVRGWLEAVVKAASPYLSTAGGPIINWQLDDEPSYWQQLHHPLALDYNPILVEERPGGSRYGRWLLDRYESLDDINTRHRSSYQRPDEILPPTNLLSSEEQLPRFLDWLDFKLSLVDEHVLFQYETIASQGVEVTISMLFPYLLPLQAAKFAAFARARELPLQLTNESYLSLFSATGCPEQKIGHITMTHETYNMWRGANQGPPVTMELQASNSSFIAPGTMELLYALTVARGIRGINYFMMVGGTNPSGFENATGSEYDIDAPIGKDGQRRPHRDVIHKLSRIVKTSEPTIMSAEPLRDVWIGCYVPYEAAALVDVDDVVFDRDALQSTFSMGDMGLSDAPSLFALLALNSVSLGCLDLERSEEGELGAARQLWVPSLHFLDRFVQSRLCDYVRGGGHLVLLPCVPVLDEHMDRCRILSDLALDGAEPPDVRPFAPGPETYSLITTPDGVVVAPGPVDALALPEGAEALAWTENGDPCAFTRATQGGRVTTLGFRLQYMPTSGESQHRFALRLAEYDAPRQASSKGRGLVAGELSGPAGGIVCVANPVELPGSGVISYTSPGSGERRRFPVALDVMSLPGRGARLLPVDVPLMPSVTLRHATWELVSQSKSDGLLRLAFSCEPRELGEIAFAEPVDPMVEAGQVIRSTSGQGAATILVVKAEAQEVVVLVQTPGS